MQGCGMILVCKNNSFLLFLAHTCFGMLKSLLHLPE